MLQSHRALAVMRGSLREERLSIRNPLHLSGSVRSSHGAGDDHIAFTRDLSASGLFFYSDLEPRVAEDLTLTLVTPHGGCLLLQGRVVRIEHRSPGSAVGIAIALYSQLLAS